MTIMLELDSNQETRLRDQAEALGLAPVDYLKRVAGLENPGEIVGNEFAGQRGRMSSPAVSERRTARTILAGSLRICPRARARHSRRC